MQTSTVIKSNTNPALPPKLHKSLTNLKLSTDTSNAIVWQNTQISNKTNSNNHVAQHHQYHTQQHHKNNNSHYNGNNTNTSGNTNAQHRTSSKGLTLSKEASPFGIKSQTPPTLTLPSSTSSSSNAVDQSNLLSVSREHGIISTATTTTTPIVTSSRINSSTFYPLQNGNVTYTLPRVLNGERMSLNSTIKNVVSKVPSVINMPPSNNKNNNLSNINDLNHSHNNSSKNSANHNEDSVKHKQSFNIIKSNVLLLDKMSSKQSNKVITTNKSKNGVKSNQGPTTTSGTGSTTISTASSPVSSSTVNRGGTISTQPTNNNMQTQTITSTLAPNFYADVDYSVGVNDWMTEAKDEDKEEEIIMATGTMTTTAATILRQALPVCTTSRNCLNPKEHYLPTDTSLEDDYLSECENCKFAQSSKYYLDTKALKALPSSLSLSSSSSSSSPLSSTSALLASAATLTVTTSSTGSTASGIMLSTAVSTTQFTSRTNTTSSSKMEKTLERTMEEGTFYTSSYTNKSKKNM